MPKRYPDITGVRFGRLVAMYESGKGPSGHSVWRCRCDCGVEKDINRVNLRDRADRKGDRSCGCLRRELGVARGTAARKYALNARAFLERSSEMAYWLGFIMADGCLTEGSPGKPRSAAVQVTLAVTDRGHLEKLNRFLQSDTAIRYVNSHGSYAGGKGAVSVAYRGREFCESLRALGVVPRKSGKESVPPGFEDDPDFWRGMIDGDGWVGHSQREGCAPQAFIGLCGSKDVCEAFAAFVGRRTASRPPTVSPDKSIWRVCQGGRKGADIVRILYAGACCALDRKAIVAEHILGMDWSATDVRMCSIEGCGHESRAWGLCSMHWQRMRRHGSPHVRTRNNVRQPPAMCSVPECKRQHFCRGLCCRHYNAAFYKNRSIPIDGQLLSSSAE